MLPPYAGAAAWCSKRNPWMSFACTNFWAERRPHLVTMWQLLKCMFVWLCQWFSHVFYVLYVKTMLPMGLPWLRMALTTLSLRIFIGSFVAGTLGWFKLEFQSSLRLRHPTRPEDGWTRIGYRTVGQPRVQPRWWVAAIDGSSNKCQATGETSQNARLKLLLFKTPRPTKCARLEKGREKIKSWWHVQPESSSSCAKNTGTAGGNGTTFIGIPASD